MVVNKKKGKAIETLTQTWCSRCHSLPKAYNLGYGTRKLVGNGSFELGLYYHVENNMGQPPFGECFAYKEEQVQLENTSQGRIYEFGPEPITDSQLQAKVDDISHGHGFALQSDNKTTSGEHKHNKRSVGIKLRRKNKRMESLSFCDSIREEL